jgi:hypothetical protein
VRRKVLLSVGVTLAILAVGEAGLRVVHWRDMRAVRAAHKGGGGCFIPSSDADLVYEYTPNRCRQNSRGYRGEEHALAKPAGVFRIVIIGDSVAAGQGVPIARSFGEELETRMNAGGRWDERFETVVLARTGYATKQELVILRKEAYAYGPDLLVWSYVLNDPASPLYGTASGELSRMYARKTSLLARFVASKLFAIEERWRSRDCPQEYHARLHCAYRDEVRSALAEIGASSRAHRVPAVFLIHPVFEEVPFSQSPLKGLHRELAAIAGANGLHVIDLLGVFARYPVARMRLAAADPWHPSVFAHEVIARELERAMAASGFYGARGAPRLR